MDVDKHQVELDKELGIILIEHKMNTVTLDYAIEISQMFENSIKLKFKYCIIKRQPGYYFSYVIKDRTVICCGNMSKKECIDKTKNYAKLYNSQN